MMPERDIVYNKTILSDGIRIVSERMPSTRSVAIGIWVDVGSRDESDGEHGVSHFIEHLFFKGTKNRTAADIALSLEALGGNLNAFTSREHTCFHAHVLDEHLEEAMDVLSDLTINSLLRPEHVEREKAVVIEEIHEVRENPSDLIHEIFSEAFWRGQPLGHSILGTEKSVRALKRRYILEYMRHHYCAGRIVVAAAGNVSHRRLVDIVKKKLHYPRGIGERGAVAQMPQEPSWSINRNGSKQNHICLGFPGVPFNSPERFALVGLYTYLGAGMSSVLFQKIREQKGMAYTIFAFTDFYRDSGILGVYFGAERKRLGEALMTTFKELAKVKIKKLTPAKLDEVKTQIKGSLVLAMESSGSRMNRLGRQEILTGEYMSLGEILKMVDKIKAESIIECARRTFSSSGLTLASLGPGSEKDFNPVDYSILDK